jgi:hypothetical protein
MIRPIAPTEDKKIPYCDNTPTGRMASSSWARRQSKKTVARDLEKYAGRSTRTWVPEGVFPSTP